MPRGKGDRMFAVSAGIGVVPPGRDVGNHRIAAGDAIVVSGPIGDHGATIMACRHGLASDELRSDGAPVSVLVEALFAAGVEVHALHDPTRGGVVAVCNEAAGRSGTRFALAEDALPIRPQVRAVCELLGLEPLALAAEGRFLAWVAAADGERAVGGFRPLDLLSGHDLPRIC